MLKRNATLRNALELSLFGGQPTNKYSPPVQYRVDSTRSCSGRRRCPPTTTTSTRRIKNTPTHIHEQNKLTSPPINPTIHLRNDRSLLLLLPSPIHPPPLLRLPLPILHLQPPTPLLPPRRHLARHPLDPTNVEDQTQRPHHLHPSLPFPLPLHHLLLLHPRSKTRRPSPLHLRPPLAHESNHETQREERARHLDAHAGEAGPV